MKNLFVFSVLGLGVCANALALIKPSVFGRISCAKAPALTAYLTKGSEGDYPPEEFEEYTGSVDWDAEWKKVVASEKKGVATERPGKDFYKSEAEIAAIKAANAAAEKASTVGNTIKSSIPDIRSLSGDWKVGYDEEKMFVWT